MRQCFWLYQFVKIKYNLDLSEIWFDVYERTLATCIGSYATLAGIAFGYTFSSLFFY